MGRIRNQELYERLRIEYPVFTYEDFNYSITGNDLTLDFRFSIGKDIFFHPRTIVRTGILTGDLNDKIDRNRPLIENLVFQIGLIELISYWKASCSPILRIVPASLTREQVNWWRKLYFQGLGEFFYLNSIEADYNEFIDIRPSGLKTFSIGTAETEDKYLVPIGGGKDSAVTLTLLRDSGKTLIPLIINPRGATIETVKAAGLEMTRALVIERQIDPVLLELNKRGFLNGHTPFSAMLAFYTLLCSAVTGHKNIALSNESSANESTIPGTNINHQYSKSVEFERDFREYCSANISSDFNYFSLLRPLSELQIARIFSGLTAYHDVFRSCNAGSKTDSWCAKCPKCMFTHIMLSAFAGIQEADRIIGSHVLNDREMVSTFDELAGYAEIKPFECVGTTLEVRQALRIITDRIAPQPLPFLLERFVAKTTGLIPHPDFLTMEEPHFVPAELIEVLKSRLR